ncbi:MAG: FAD:protein FMN transferase [Magnetospirillum sp.]|nr:FAD:protein FMN transferase [Magnetospirillum sp.]
MDATAERVVLPPGTALTLNGIAQGYVTDAIVGLLRSQGMRHVLANLGEIAALGLAGDGHAWRVGLPDGGERALSDGALAVSMPDGTRFSPLCHHLFDPATGRSAASPCLVVVQAETATEADAISTAIAASGGKLSASTMGAGPRQGSGRSMLNAAP